MNRIKELRKSKNVTLQEVSEKTGISVTSLSFYEKGQRNPKIETWQKLADYFDVSVGYLQGLGLSKSKLINYLTDGLKDPNSWKKYDNDIHSIIWENLSTDEKITVTDILNKKISEIEKNSYLKNFITNKYSFVNNYSFLARLQGNELNEYNEYEIISHVDNSIINRINSNIYNPNFGISDNQKIYLSGLFEDVIYDYSSKIAMLENEIQNLRTQLSNNDPNAKD